MRSDSKTTTITYNIIRITRKKYNQRNATSFPDITSRCTKYNTPLRSNMFKCFPCLQLAGDLAEASTEEAGTAEAMRRHQSDASLQSCSVRNSRVHSRVRNRSEDPNHCASEVGTVGIERCMKGDTLDSCSVNNRHRRRGSPGMDRLGEHCLD